jgi:hypothetical protein
MVHISLPHRQKDKGKPTAGDLHPDQSAEQQRPSPSRSPAQNAIANGGEKPLILKIYVIRVGLRSNTWRSFALTPFHRLETLQQRIGPGQAIRYIHYGQRAKRRLTATVSGRELGNIETINTDYQQEPQPRMEDLLRHATRGRPTGRMYLLGQRPMGKRLHGRIRYRG